MDCAGDMVVGVVFIAADIDQVVTGVHRCHRFLEHFLRFNQKRLAGFQIFIGKLLQGFKRGGDGLPGRDCRYWRLAGWCCLLAAAGQQSNRDAGDQQKFCITHLPILLEMCENMHNIN